MSHREFVEQAMRDHGDAVFRLACSLLQSPEAAEDIVQDTFAKLCRTSRAFENDQHVRYWLLAVAGNASRDALRRQQTAPVTLVDPTAPEELEALAAQLTAQSDTSPRTETGIDPDHFLWRHVAALPFSQRQVIHLRYVEELKPREIARVLGESSINVRQRLSRAHKRLRSMIESDSAPTEGGIR
ncbi:sigma-70 family RNA polymerase sigma factor [Eggerthellaceae bacterium 24-137]